MTAARRSRRLEREERTLEVMVAMYCRDHHQDDLGPGAGRRSGRARPQTLCAECDALLAYAQRKLAGCRYATAKPTCAKCPTHCYKPEMRERVRAVMRYSGPRMLREHPALAVGHLADGRRRAPGQG
jgi:Nitrous oxide-stimulated promoter